MSRYLLDRTFIPNTSLKVLTRLGKTLIHDKPEPTNEVIETATLKLIQCLAEVDEALTARVRDSNPEIMAGEAEFDRATDTQWIWLRKLLEGWASALGHPGLAALPEELQAKVDLEGLREKAERSRKLHERLFGAEGTNWAQRPYVEQVESMAALLRLIAEDELGGELESIVGLELLPLLEACQLHYETMVAERMSRSSGMRQDFRELRAKLRWKIDRYKNAVETLRDDEDPDSYAVVDEALRALVLLNQRMSKTGAAGDDELLGEGLVALEEPIEPPLVPEPEQD